LEKKLVCYRLRRNLMDELVMRIVMREIGEIGLTLMRELINSRLEKA
jgi:hypothetical protein